MSHVSDLRCFGWAHTCSGRACRVHGGHPSKGGLCEISWGRKLGQISDSIVRWGVVLVDSGDGIGRRWNKFL